MITKFYWVRLILV